MLCTEVYEDDIVEITSIDECEKIAKMLGKRWDPIPKKEDPVVGWNGKTRNCNYWVDRVKRGQKFLFNKYGNKKGKYSQQACKKEVIDKKSPQNP